MLQKQQQADAWTDYIEQRGSRYADCKLDNFECYHDGQRDAVSRLRATDVQADFDAGRNVVLFGAEGGGKDHLITGLYRRLVAEASLPDFIHGQEVGRISIRSRWFTGREMFVKWRDAQEAGIEWEFIHVLKICPLLMISDPARPSGPLTEAEQNVFLDVLDGRYSNNRPTWMTINADAREDVQRAVGAAAAGRIRDNALAVYCNWPSYRQPQQSQKETAS